MAPGGFIGRAALLAGLFVTAAPAAPLLRPASQILRVPTSPPSLIEQAPAPAPIEENARNRCLSSDEIVGAIVNDERSVELTLRDGRRFRMGFSSACPALGYYQGFYYRRSRAGLLCAGRDSVMDRSGVECPISRLSPLRRMRRR